MPAPIAIFAYNRPDHLAAVLRALTANEQAAQSRLFIFCDGPKPNSDETEILAARRVAHSAHGFLDVSVVEQEENRGLSASIMAGVGEICARFGRVIVLEDDVVPTPYFLGYANAALDAYRDREDVFSVGCHTFDAGYDLPETFFLNIPDCWGWAIWQRSWESFQSDGRALLDQIVARNAGHAFDMDGAYPYTQMLRDQVAGLNQSWAIRLYAHVFLNNKLVLYPRRSVTSNIGFDGSGTHGGTAKGYSAVRTADRPVVVSAVGMEESALAREAWKAALGDMATASIADVLKSRLGRVRRAIGPYVRRVLP